jgi:formamidopyrimidine-DNA glycosylase
MPELPDISLYIERLTERVRGQTLLKVRLASPFLVRTAVPPLSAAYGRVVQGFERIGKRIVFDLGDELYMVLHLMIAGRLRWREIGAKVPNKVGLCAFDFPEGSLILTEASSKKRAALHMVQGKAALRAIDPGGIDVLNSSVQDFRQALTRENHTIKRSLTDPRILSGIGNAYSDEILHHARLSPIRFTQKMTDDEFARLHASTKIVLERWIELLREELGVGAFPEQVTAFRKGMAVHGRYGQPCPDCGAKVQRIAYADNETNYCARCQTGGKLLADRSLSRLLRDDWPKTLTELEERAQARAPQTAPARIVIEAPPAQTKVALTDEPIARVQTAAARTSDAAPRVETEAARATVKRPRTKKTAAHTHEATPRVETDTEITAPHAEAKAPRSNQRADLVKTAASRTQNLAREKAAPVANAKNPPAKRKSSTAPIAKKASARSPKASRG